MKGMTGIPYLTVRQEYRISHYDRYTVSHGTLGMPNRTVRQEYRNSNSMFLYVKFRRHSDILVT